MVLLVGICVVVVVNFFEGEVDLMCVVVDIELIVSVGGDEVDVVLFYCVLMDGCCDEVVEFFFEVCEVSWLLVLKVIIESGELKMVEWVGEVIWMVLVVGVDFVKMSIGKMFILVMF